jgi:carboxypeptidase D
MGGLFNENGPLRVELAEGDTTGKNLVMTRNPYGWHSLTDMFYVDQPVGTGYSTANRHGHVVDEDQVGVDFVSDYLPTYYEY